jgi:hypothetical protein
LSKLRTIKDRAKAWEALNPKLDKLDSTPRPSAPAKFSALHDEMWEDVEDQAGNLRPGNEGGIAVPKLGEIIHLPMHLPPAHVPLPPEEEDEIL